MKNIKTILFSLLISFSIYGQSVVNHKLDWKTYEFGTQNILGVQGYGYSFNSLPQITSKVLLGSNQILTASVSILESETVSQSEKNTIPVFWESQFSSTPNLKVEYSIAMKKKYALINIEPLYLENGVLKKITSYSLSYSKSTIDAESSRSGSRSFKGTSALVNGTIARFNVIKNGVHKITYSDLENNGIITGSILSNSINLYGNHNGMLSEVNGNPRIDDLEKNAIKMIDGGDGQFDDGDYFLFYAQGPHKWKLNSAGSYYTYEQHLYSDEASYFVKVNDNSGTKRIATISDAGTSFTQAISSFNDFGAREDETTNLMNAKNKGGSGKLWVGTIFDAVRTNSFKFSFPNISSTSNVRVFGSFYASSSSASNFSMNVGSLANTNIAMPAVNSGTHSDIAINRSGSLSFLPNQDNINVNLSYTTSPGVGGEGYLDFIEINVRRDLTMAGNQMEFRDLLSTGTPNIGKFEVANASSIDEIWDVTDPLNSKNVSFARVGNKAEFIQKTDSLRTFIALTTSGYLVPIFVEKVENQNLHGELIPDMLIVYHPLFENQVQQLKEFHEGNGLTVLEATVQEIYNEFSGGVQDVSAIKTFAKMFYDRGGLNPPKYLLLFGDGSFDYKNRVTPNHNFVPVWESVESLADIKSYTSDDFFAILDDGESIGYNQLMDIAVGRLTVTNAGQAQIVVDKIINYQKQGTLASEISNCNDLNSGSPYGDWRNKLIFIADDVDNTWEKDFVRHIETICDTIEKNQPFFNIEKVYMDAYNQTSASGGERYLEGAEVIKRTVEEGALITTYEGHGGEIGWGTERFLDLGIINSWTNSNRLSVFLTATCEFTKFDDPSRVSAGEQCFLNPNGGGVAMFTTTRPVYQFSNEQLINAFYEEVFVKNADGTPRTLGEIYMETKNSSSVVRDVNSRRFSLIGDPALKLAFPKNKIVTTEVNNVLVTNPIDTLKALSKITIKGFIADNNGVLKSGYNGVIFPTVFDKPVKLSTLGNRVSTDVIPFQLQNSVLYKGKASVKNGLFEFTFLVPKDINYQFGNGKISYYCYDGSEDGAGAFTDIVVGGTNTGASTDSDGPLVGLFMNDNNFVSGGITDDKPSIFAELFDSNGINTTGNGIGHDLTAILDEKTSNPIILNDYYESDLDSYQSGKIVYPLSKIAEGNHTLSLKTWDIYNNSTEKNIEFLVIESQELAIDRVLNYPNPFTTRTQFFFEHNQSCEFLQVQIQVFTVSGKLVKTISQLVKTEGFRVKAIEWDGKDDYGDDIGRGTYVYKVKVTDDNGNTVEKYEKLVLLK
jgi:hypothetical protein